MIEYANVVTRTYFHIFSIFMFRAQLRWLGRILRELEMMLFGKSFLNQILFTPLPRPRSSTFRQARRKRGRPHTEWTGTFFCVHFSEIYKLTLKIEIPLPLSHSIADVFKLLSSADVVCSISHSIVFVITSPIFSFQSLT